MFTSFLLTFLNLSMSAMAYEHVAEATFAASYYRLGAQADMRYGLRTPMFEKDDSVLFQGTGLKTVATLAATPAYLRAGGRITFTPLAIVDLHIHGGYDQYFGNFQTVVGYPDPSDNYGTNADIAQHAEDTDNQMTGRGYHVGGQIVVKAKAGPIIVVGSGDLTHFNIQSEATGPWFFEREKEVMMSLNGDGDIAIDTNGLLMYQMDFEDNGWARLGSFTTWRGGLKSEDRLLRSGLIASYNNGSAFTHNLIVQPYLSDRAFTSPWPPYTAYALKFEG